MNEQSSVDHLCYGEDTFIRNIVLLRPKNERDIYFKKVLLDGKFTG